MVGGKYLYGRGRGLLCPYCPYLLPSLRVGRPSEDVHGSSESRPDPTSSRVVKGKVEVTFHADQVQQRLTRVGTYDPTLPSPVEEPSPKVSCSPV